MGKCPKCGVYLGYIRLVRTEFMEYDIYLNNSKRGLDYSNCNQTVDVDKEGWAECPECEEPLVDMGIPEAEKRIKKILKGMI